MAELSIKTIIDAGKKSLEDKNYWSALVVALTLPSMCSRVEYADERYKGNNRSDEGIWYEDNKGIHWHDKRAYVKWCSEWMSSGLTSTIDGKLVQREYQKDESLVSKIGENYAEKFYEMRCNLLHQCETDIEHGLGIPIFFSIEIIDTIFPDECIIQIETICDDIFYYAESWIDTCHSRDLPTRQYYNGNSRDDQLLYKRLCENSRADYLLDKHNKELDRRSGQ